MNKSILFISSSEKCAKGSDGTMSLSMHLHRSIHKASCITMDSGYTLFIEKFKENANEDGYDFDDRDFLHPIRKEIGNQLSVSELNFNTKYGSFRSEIENQFSVLSSIFQRFNNNKAALQMTDKKYYNLQFKVACLLKNMYSSCELYDIQVEPHYMLWYSDSFEFPTKINKINLVFSDERKVNKEYNVLND